MKHGGAGWWAMALGTAWLAAGCGQAPAPAPPPAGGANAPGKAFEPGAGGWETGTNRSVPVYTGEVVRAFPHDREAFTQGLVFLDGVLWESTGLNGQSTLRQVDLETGQVLRRVGVPAQYFAEGLAALGGKLFQLTWQNQKAFVYDLKTLRLERELGYPGEGWGLTTDGRWLIMSDGTDQLRFLDPQTFAEKRRISVRAGGGRSTA
jgi:glutaminyl-peptide cyclotransferase